MFTRKMIAGLVLTVLCCVPVYAYEINLLMDVPVTGEVSAIAINGRTDTAATISKSGKSLSVINIASGAVEHQAAVPATPSGIAIHKTSNKAIVSTLEGSILLYDLGSAELTQAIVNDDPVYSISIDESAITAVLGVDGGIRVIDLSNGKVLKSVTFPGKATQSCLGKGFLVVAGTEANGTKLRTIDLETGKVSKEIPLSGGVESIAMDEPLGCVLVTQTHRAGLSLYDASTLQEIGHIQTGKQMEIFSVNPSTHMAVLSDTLSGSLTVASLETISVVGTLALFQKSGPVAVDPERNLALVGHENGVAVVKLENPIPTLTELVPTSAASEGEVFPLSLFGTRFIKDSQTWFNEKPADTLFAGNEYLKANILPDELIYPGTVTVSVFNPAPGGGMSNDLFFKVLTPVPRISTLNPGTVAVGGPAFTMKVEGKNFMPGSAVTINGQKSQVKFVSSTLLEVAVDAVIVSSKGSYPVLVTNTGPTTANSNVLSLNVATAEEADATQKEAALAAQQGTGALVGKILDTYMQPVEGATIRHKNISVQTDATGSFILVNIPAGKRTILIDGSTAMDSEGHFPTIPITADIIADKQNPMPFTPYLHRQKNRNFVHINPAQDTILTDPELPGFEMRIPKGVHITGWDGKKNLKVSVRTVPTDRLPVKPLPKNSYVKTVYMFYFNKIGGGRPDQPIPIRTPNDLGLLPGEKAVLWYYDESPIEGEAPNDWAIAGTGTVTPDGKYIVTDPGVGIPKFCCGATAWGSPGGGLPSGGKECPLLAQAGDPVDLATGYFIHEQTDLFIPGIIPVEIKRTYRNRDGGSAVQGTSAGLGAFGKGMSLNYDWWLGSYNSMMRLVKPGNYQYDFALQPDGSYLNTVDPEMRGAKVTVNPDGTRTLRMRDGHIYKFESAGGLIEIVDRYGNKVTIARRHGSPDEGGYATSITTAEGRVFTFSQTYTGNFFRTDSITDSSGRMVKYSYETDPFNPYPRLKKVNYADGTSIQYGYDSQGRMSTITNQRGIVEVTNEYDSNNRIYRQTHADGAVFTFSYTEAGGYVTQTTMTAPNNAQTTWRFNSYGYITEKTTTDGTIFYEKAVGSNELLSLTDPLNRTTSYTYYSTSDARNGLVQTVTDPLNNVTSYEYETTYGLPTKLTDAKLKETTVIYTPAGAPPTQAVITDPLTHPTTVMFNSYGMPVSIEDPLHHTTNFTYDSDHHAELTRVTDPLGNTTDYFYDELGRVSVITDAKGAMTTYAYDSAERVNSVTDAMNGITRYFYDANGNLVMLIDSKGNSILYEFDNRDRIVKMTDQLGRFETYEYYTGTEITSTTGDNLKSFTDRKGQATTFNEYDPQDRLKQVTFNDGSYIQYTYDAVGRVTDIYDSISGSISRVYNDFGCSSCSGRGLDLVSQEVTPLSTVVTPMTRMEEGRA